MSKELSTLANWLVEKGSLFLQIAAPEGDTAPARKIHSLSELRDVISEVRTPGTAVLISKEEASLDPKLAYQSSDVITLRAYVQYADLFTPAHLSTISQWLLQQGEVFVQIELPDTSGEGYYHVVDSLPALQKAVNEVHHPEVEIFIWKDPDQSIPMEMVHSRPDQVMYFAVRKNRKPAAKASRIPKKAPSTTLSAEYN
jgi:hypothetical protein